MVNRQDRASAEKNVRRICDHLPIVVFFLLIAFVLESCDQEVQTPAPLPAVQTPKVMEHVAVTQKDMPLSQQILFYGKLPFADALSVLDLNHDKRMDVADLEVLRTRSGAESNGLNIDLLSLLIGNGSDMPIGLLDFNRDGIVNEDDYRLPATFPQTFQPFYSKQEATSLIASGARAYMYPVPATNLMYADLEANYVWDAALEIPKLQFKKQKSGAWELIQADASEHMVHAYISSPDRMITLELSNKGSPKWSDGDQLIWGHFLWGYDGTSFHIVHAVAADANTGSEPHSFLEHVFRWMIPPALAEEAISPEIASQFNDYDASVWLNNAELSRSMKDLTDRLKKHPECKTLDCSALKDLIAEMDQQVDAASGAHALSVMAKKNAERIWEFQSHTVSAIRKGNDRVKRVLFWQKSALFAGDLAADLMDSLLTGNPTAIADDLASYGIGAGADMLMSKSKFVSSLSDGMGGMGVLSMEDGKIKFDPSSGSFDKIKNINTVLTAKDAKKIRQAKLALTSMILKSIIKASTSSALENTEKDLRDVSKALAEAKAFDRDMGMAAMLYGNAEKRMRKVLGRAQGQRHDILSLLHDCEYQERKKSCTAELQTRFSQAASIREKIEGDAVKQEREKAATVKLLEEKYQATLNNTKILQKKKHAANEHIIELIRATTSSNKAQIAEKRNRYETEIKRLNVQQGEQWEKIKGIKKNLNEQRHQLNTLSQQNRQRKWQANDAYRKAVMDANSAFQKCLGAKHVFIPMRRAAKIHKNADGLIPPWLIYESFVQAQSKVLNKIRAAKLWKDDPDCEKETSTAGVFAGSGCWTAGMLGTKLALFSKTKKGLVRGLFTWPTVDSPITLEGHEENGHLLLKGSSKEFSEYAMMQSLQLDLQQHVVTRGGNTASPYTAVELKGDMITSNFDGTERNTIRFLPLYSSVTSISIVNASFNQGLDSVTPGSSIWIQAKGENTCSRATDKMVLVMRVPSVPTPQNIAVMLTETDPDSGIFKSGDKGIAIHGNPGSGHARIFIEPEGFAAISPALFGQSRGQELFKRAGSVSAAIRFVNKSSTNEVKKTTGNNPLMPDVSYQAVQTIDGTRSIIYYTPGKRRSEPLAARNVVSIFRDDKHLIWQLWIKEKKYMEMNMPPQIYGFSEISRKKLGNERVNGIDTTKYRIRSKGKNGADTEGIFWISDDNIPVKSQTSMNINGKERRMVIELSDIKIGSQKPSLFEIPEGFTLRTMNGMGG